MTEPEPTAWQLAAAELRRIASAIEGLQGAPSYMSVDFQTKPERGTDEEIAAGADAVATAVLDQPGEDRSLSDVRQRHANRYTHPMPGVIFGVSVYQMYETPDPKDTEIERPRADEQDA